MMRTTLLFLLLWGAALPGWANLSAVDPGRLARYDLIAADLKYLKDHQSQFDHWTQTWPYAEPKAGCLALLRGAAARVQALKEQFPEDPDLALLLLVVDQYRYNLDDNAVASEFRALQQETADRFPRDYRPLWFLAVFQTHGGRSVDAVRTFQKILPTPAQVDAVHPALLLDYAQACYTAAMLPSARIALDRYLGRTGLTASEVPLVGMVAQLLKPADPAAAYGAADLWKAETQGTKVRYSSQAFTTAFEVPDDWKVSFGRFQRRSLVVQVTPPAVVSRRGKAITLNLVLVQSAEDQDFDAFAAQFEGGMRGFRFDPVGLELPSAPFRRADRVTNPDLYPDRDGMAGYALFFGCPAGPVAGFGIDTPVDLPAAEGQTRSVRLTSQLDRFPGRLNTVILVDSCVEIEAETTELVEAFLKTLRVN